jgi:hypothetical protein
MRRRAGKQAVLLPARGESRMQLKRRLHQRRLYANGQSAHLASTAQPNGRTMACVSNSAGPRVVEHASETETSVGVQACAQRAHSVRTASVWGSSTGNDTAPWSA